LYEAITRAVVPLGISFEIVFVDDGSRDATVSIADEIARADPRVCLVKFRRNYGQTPAMAAGIAQASGDVIVTMDGDLQNDPADIGALLRKIDEGNDIVVGWRFDRQDKMVSRKIPSRIANALIAKVTGVPIKDNGCSLKAYRASLIKRIPLYNEMHRFIPAMASLAAPKIAQIKVRHHPRRFGSSKYGFSRIYKVFVDLLTIRTILSFSRRPSAWLGTVAAAAGLLSAVVIALSLALMLDGTDSSSVVFTGIGVLLGSLAIFTVFLGFLTQLLHRTMATRLRPFVVMAAKPIDLVGPVPGETA
jgi:glycosyltransferase involved in cell wall biosynthesis